MTIANQPTLMTTEELDAMPDDGVERWLIDGQLREAEGSDVTRRNYGHSRIEAKIAQLLGNWNDRQQPRGEVVVGEAGIRISRDPDTSVGADVAYISAETVAANTDENRFIEGVPVLIVEVLSPYDKHLAVMEKVDRYLSHGVKLVWVVEPKFRTITVYRPDMEPQLYNLKSKLSGEPYLPGFEANVAEIFAR